MGLNFHGDVIGCGQVEPLLAAKVVGDGLEIDARGAREHARRGAIETVPAEDGNRGLEQSEAEVVAPG